MKIVALGRSPGAVCCASSKLMRFVCRAQLRVRQAPCRLPPHRPLSLADTRNPGQRPEPQVRDRKTVLARSEATRQSPETRREIASLARPMTPPAEPERTSELQP